MNTQYPLFMDEPRFNQAQSVTQLLFNAKSSKGLSFSDLALALGRTEVAVAAIFFKQARATPEEIDTLSYLLEIPACQLIKPLTSFPSRGNTTSMPPSDPFIYRLYEIVRNYGHVYKVLAQEKLGDGIMSSVGFFTSVSCEIDATGKSWVMISMRGKWIPYSNL